MKERRDRRIGSRAPPALHEVVEGAGQHGHYGEGRQVAAHVVQPGDGQLYGMLRPVMQFAAKGALRADGLRELSTISIGVGSRPKGVA